MRRLAPAVQTSQYRSSRELAWGGSRLVNCFAERTDGDQREQFAILPTPGLTVWITVGSGPWRGDIVMGGTLYVVSGQELYSVTTAGVSTLLGTITGTGPVRMAANYTQVAIAVSNGDGYVWDGSILIRPLSWQVSDVAYLDGYIVWSVRDAQQIFISALDDATTYDAADITSVEGTPDNIVGLLADHRELIIHKTDSSEIYYNSGALDFPLERQGNAFIERGCFDRDSIVKEDSTDIFMGDDRIIYRLAGYEPQRISNHAVEDDLRTASYARAWKYTLGGHKFYILELDETTWGLDLATGLWHERKSYLLDHWRAFGGIVFNGKLLFGDRANGNLYTVNPEVHTENGSAIQYDIYPPTIEAEREWLTMWRYEVLMETGVGNSSVANPQVILRYSDDNGHTWSNEMQRSLGAVGAYGTQAVWGPLGRFRARCMHIRVTDAVKRLVVAHFADVSG